MAAAVGPSRGAFPPASRSRPRSALPSNPAPAGPAAPKATLPAAPPQSATEFQRFAASSVGEVLPIFGASLFEHVPTTFAPLDRVAGDGRLCRRSRR